MQYPQEKNCCAGLLVFVTIVMISNRLVNFLACDSLEEGVLCSMMTFSLVKPSPHHLALR